MRKITVADIETVVAENQDKTNNFDADECRYFIDGLPACVMGKVIEYVGGGPNYITEEERIIRFPRLFSTEVAALLADELQEAADKQMAWGEAYKLAEKLVGLRRKATV